MSDPQALDKLIYGDEHQQEFDYEAEPVTLEGAADADFHLRRAGVARRQLEHEQGLFRAELDRIRGRLEVREEKFQREIAWHEAAVERWHRNEVRHGRAKGKTITLPSGRSSLTKRQPVIHEPQGDNADRFRDFARKIPVGEGGERWVDEVWRTTTEEKFLVSKLKGMVEIHPDDLKKEPGSVARLVLRSDTSKVVPGVTAVIMGDNWKAAE